MALFCSGCASAGIVYEQYHPKAAVIEYKDNEASADLAKQTASDFCGGSYSIESNEARSAVVGYSVMQSNSFPIVRNRNYMRVRCCQKLSDCIY